MHCSLATNPGNEQGNETAITTLLDTVPQNIYLVSGGPLLYLNRVALDFCGLPLEDLYPAPRFRKSCIRAAVNGSWRTLYSEPAEGKHFAQTGSEPVLVQISGFGPTDAHYVNPGEEPKPRAGK